MEQSKSLSPSDSTCVIVGVRDTAWFVWHVYHGWMSSMVSLRLLDVLGMGIRQELL